MKRAETIAVRKGLAPSTINFRFQKNFLTREIRGNLKNVSMKLSLTTGADGVAMVGLKEYATMPRRQKDISTSLFSPGPKPGYAARFQL